MHYASGRLPLSTILLKHTIPSRHNTYTRDPAGTSCVLGQVCCVLHKVTSLWVSKFQIALH